MAFRWTMLVPPLSFFDAVMENDLANHEERESKTASGCVHGRFAEVGLR